MPLLPGINYPITGSLSSPITLNNDQNTLLNIFTLDSTTIKSSIINYSILRGSTTETGRLLIATDGSSVSVEDDKANNGDTGITILSSMSGSLIQVQYLSTNTGQSATFRYSSQTLN